MVDDAREICGLVKVEKKNNVVNVVNVVKVAVKKNAGMEGGIKNEE